MTSNSLCTFTNLFIHARLELSFKTENFLKNDIYIWINTFEPTWRKKKEKKTKEKDPRKILSIYLCTRNAVKLDEN